MNYISKQIQVYVNTKQLNFTIKNLTIVDKVNIFLFFLDIICYDFGMQEEIHRPHKTLQLYISTLIESRTRKLSGASTNYYLWRRTLLYLHDNMITWNINYIPSVSVIVTQFTSLYHVFMWWSSLVEKLIRVLLSWVNYIATNLE